MSAGQALSRPPGAVMSQKKSGPIRQLRRYAGCRLYDQETGTNLAADDLRRLILAGSRISVHEVENGQDVTHEVVSENLH